jgi:hypothetical protein
MRPILYTKEQKNETVENTLADLLALLLLTPPRFPTAEILCVSTLGGLVIFSRLCVFYVALLDKVVVFVVLDRNSIGSVRNAQAAQQIPKLFHHFSM